MLQHVHLCLLKKGSMLRVLCRVKSGTHSLRRDILASTAVQESCIVLLTQRPAAFNSQVFVQGQVQVAVRKLLAFYGEEVGSITITGHSLGGALAQICAFDLVESGVNHQGDSKRGALVPVTAITFEAPRAGEMNNLNFIYICTFIACTTL